MKEKSTILIVDDSELNRTRKQMTWFKRDEEIEWFHPEDETEILNSIEKKL